MKSRVDVGLLGSLCAVAFLNLISIQAGSFPHIQTEDTSDCLLCRQCGYDVSDVIHLHRRFSPSALVRGNQSLFGPQRVEYQVLENPLGIQFKVVTVARARCAATEEWHSEFSWFPGYAWKHCLCIHCGHHLGWIFEPLATAVKGQVGPTNQGFYAIILDNILSEKFSDSLLIIPRVFKS
ncbi:protein cereblon [Anabrus simplex]|uniref:protein cereblon n=1 Tax=Anabrus simplex TaxID=316456 RepID=UPI0035A3BAE5